MTLETADPTTAQTNGLILDSNDPTHSPSQSPIDEQHLGEEIHQQPDDKNNDRNSLLGGTANGFLYDLGIVLLILLLFVNNIT